MSNFGDRQEDIEVAFKRTGYLLADIKNSANFWKPYYYPPPKDEFNSYPELYKQVIPYEWVGDIHAIFELHKSIDHSLGTDLAHPARIWYDAGICMQLKQCGYSSVHWENCSRNRDEALNHFIGLIETNRKKMMAAFGALLNTVAGLVSFVPVVGQAVSVVLATAAAIVTEQPISKGLANAIVAAVPGGMAAKQLVSPAIEFGTSLVSGSNLEQAAIDAARDAAYQLNEYVGQAFDMLLAVSRGEDLQAAGFQIMNKWFVNMDTAKNVVEFTNKMTRAAQDNTSIEKVLMQSVKEQAVIHSQSAFSQFKDEVAGGISKLMEEPRKFIGSIERFAEENNIDIFAAQAAFMSVVELIDGQLVVNQSFKSYFTGSIDPNAPIQGESMFLDRTRKWAQRRIKVSEIQIQGTAKQTSTIRKAMQMKGKEPETVIEVEKATPVSLPSNEPILDSINEKKISPAKILVPIAGIAAGMGMTIAAGLSLPVSITTGIIGLAGGWYLANKVEQ